MANVIDTDKLMDSISQLLRLDPHQMAAIVAEVGGAAIPYKQSYSDYQSGGWHTAMLYNPTGSTDNNEIKDGHAVPTNVMKALPQTQAFLDGLGLSYFAVRVAKTEPGSYLWEHKDYIELGQDNKLRLHIPLVSNPNARMQFNNCSVHMAPGYIWKLNPTVNHSIANRGESDRTHLILDCYMNDHLQDLVMSEMLMDRYVQPKPDLGPQRAVIIDEARSLLFSAGVHKAEDLLLKSFHDYDLGNQTSYDLLVDFYKDLGFKDRERHWIKESIERMVVREKIDAKDARVNMSGTFFRVAHENPDLPHYEVLKNVLETCRKIEGLDSAYIRGSLARGDADPVSDIDLLCVVTPDKFENYIEQVRQAVQDKHGAIHPGWTDTIVKDFGGVGFVYLTEHEGKLYQLDLYIACKGSPGLQRLEDLPYKQQVFRVRRNMNTDVEQRERYAGLIYRLHEDHVKRTISNINAVPETPERTLTEINVLGFMIKKCLSRGDDFVAGNEFNMWKKAFIRLVRQKYDPELQDYGFYHVKRLKDTAPDGERLFSDLQEMNKVELTSATFERFHGYAMGFVQREFPQLYAENKETIDSINKHILQASTPLDSEKGLVQSTEIVALEILTPKGQENIAIEEPLTSRQTFNSQGIQPQ